MTQDAPSGKPGIQRIFVDVATFDAELERRMAERRHIDSFMCRFELITTQTFLIGGLTAAAGMAYDAPSDDVLMGTLIVSGACFASGIVLLGLSGAWLGTLAILQKVLGR